MYGVLLKPFEECTTFDYPMLLSISSLKITLFFSFAIKVNYYITYNCMWFLQEGKSNRYKSSGEWKPPDAHSHTHNLTTLYWISGFYLSN